MMYTLADARSFVNAFVLAGGACPNAATVTSRINEAQRRLLIKADWKFTERKMCVITYNNSITLPREVAAARLVAINHRPRRLFNTNYRYIENGPGWDAMASCCAYDLVDQGDHFPTFFDIPVHDGISYKLFLVAKENVKANPKTALITGATPPPGQQEVITNGTPGETLSLGMWANGVEGVLDDYPTPVTENYFQQVYSIHLPAGRTDYVSLYAVDPEDRGMFFLAKYHPDEMVPSYRRYEIRGYCPPAKADQDANNCAHVDLIVKMRHVPLSRETDVLLVQNLDAIKNMVLAIREENAGNLQQGLVYEQKALQILSEQDTDEQDGQYPMIQTEDHYFYRGMGQIH